MINKKKLNKIKRKNLKKKRKKERKNKERENINNKIEFYEGCYIWGGGIKMR